MFHARRMIVLASALLMTVAGQAVAQTKVASTLGAAACKAPPRPGFGQSCVDLVPGTELLVVGNVDDRWLLVEWNGGKSYVDRTRVQASVGGVVGAGPCADSLYQALKKKPLDGMTEREYQYMLERDRSCAEHQRTIITAAPQQQVAEEMREMRKKANDWFVVGFVISIVGGLFTYLATK